MEMTNKSPHFRLISLSHPSVFLDLCSPHLLIEVLTTPSHASSCPSGRVMAADAVLSTLREVADKAGDGRDTELRRSIVNVTRTHLFSKSLATF